jgi:uridine kinase
VSPQALVRDIIEERIDTEEHRLVNRESLLRSVAEFIANIHGDHPTRVAVDGVDAAGKTTFADQLRTHVAEHGRPVIRASLDGFHNPSVIRYERGRLSPEGYYLDSFNYRALLDNLLLPLGPGGSLSYREAVFDYRRDIWLEQPPSKAKADSVLLFDGVFLLRPELVSLWDLRIFLDISFDEMMRRGLERSPGDAEAETLYAQRYIPGQKLYHLHAAPKRRADIVINNNDPDDPRVTFMSPSL